MNYYFEPVNLQQWNLFEKVKEINHVETFLATKDMKLNDIVLLHVGQQDKSREPGIYAWGRIVREPYILRNNPTQYCNNKNSVDVKIEYINYNKPILSTKQYKFFRQYRTVHKLNKEVLEDLQIYCKDIFAKM